MSNTKDRLQRNKVLQSHVSLGLLSRHAWAGFLPAFLEVVAVCHDPFTYKREVICTIKRLEFRCK